MKIKRAGVNMVLKGKQIGQGNTAEIFEYGEGKILKLYKEGISKSACEQEFNITQNVYRFLGICPKAYEVVEVDGRYGASYERIDGQSMLQAALSNRRSFRKEGKQLAHYHNAIQKPVDFALPTVKEKLKRDIKRVEELTGDEKDKLYQYIDTLPEGSVLCHFDFHLDNIILRDGNAVIIDWMIACNGDRLSDVARTCILFEYSEIPTKSLLQRHMIKFMQKRLLRIYLTEYFKITQADRKELHRWKLPIAAARLSEWRPEPEKKRLLKMVHQSMRRLA
ncbi:MAG: aminoglycoside phosphotransferase family protein [Lachnospiraceae bacterium]|nr:aminoglycoside phosphotransferase family protein [Lachnospiraceae bacterium]